MKLNVIHILALILPVAISCTQSKPKSRRSSSETGINSAPTSENTIKENQQNNNTATAGQGNTTRSGSNVNIKEAKEEISGTKVEDILTLDDPDTEIVAGVPGPGEVGIDDDGSVIFPNPPPPVDAEAYGDPETRSDGSTATVQMTEENAQGQEIPTQIYVVSADGKTITIEIYDPATGNLVMTQTSVYAAPYEEGSNVDPETYVETEFHANGNPSTVKNYVYDDGEQILVSVQEFNEDGTEVSEIVYDEENPGVLVTEEVTDPETGNVTTTDCSGEGDTCTVTETDSEGNVIGEPAEVPRPTPPVAESAEYREWHPTYRVTTFQLEGDQFGESNNKEYRAQTIPLALYKDLEILEKVTTNEDGTRDHQYTKHHANYCALTGIYITDAHGTKEDAGCDLFYGTDSPPETLDQTVDATTSGANNSFEGTLLGQEEVTFINEEGQPVQTEVKRNFQYLKASKKNDSDTYCEATCFRPGDAFFLTGERGRQTYSQFDNEDDWEDEDRTVTGPRFTAGDQDHPQGFCALEGLQFRRLNGDHDGGWSRCTIKRQGGAFTLTAEGRAEAKARCDMGCYEMKSRSRYGDPGYIIASASQEISVVLNNEEGEPNEKVVEKEFTAAANSPTNPLGSMCVLSHFKAGDIDSKREGILCNLRPYIDDKPAEEFLSENSAVTQLNGKTMKWVLKLSKEVRSELPVDGEAYINNQIGECKATCFEIKKVCTLQNGTKSTIPIHQVCPYNAN